MNSVVGSAGSRALAACGAAARPSARTRLHAPPSTCAPAPSWARRCVSSAAGAGLEGPAPSRPSAARASFAAAALALEPRVSPVEADSGEDVPSASAASLAAFRSRLAAEEEAGALGDDDDVGTERVEVDARAEPDDSLAARPRGGGSRRLGREHSRAPSSRPCSAVQVQPDAGDTRGAERAGR